MEHTCPTFDLAKVEIINKLRGMGLNPYEYDIEALTITAYEQRPEVRMQYALAIAEEDFEECVSQYLLAAGA